MKTIITATFILPTLYWLGLSTFAADSGNRLTPSTGLVSEALQSLNAAVKDCSQEQATVEALAESVAKVLEKLQPSPVSEQLAGAVAIYQDGGKPEDFVQAIEKVCTKLSFQPLKEAELPKGFPTYTPDGVVEVKEYPAYRMAVAGQFWTLFRHIQSNNISMTAPVEMEFDVTSAGKLTQNSMAFLYGDTALGTPGKNGKVNVVDVKPIKVVSLGVRGSRRQDSLNLAYQYLSNWIEGHPNFEASGPPKVMGYNSPMVRRADSFFEVQVPICEKSPNVSQ